MRPGGAELQAEIDAYAWYHTIELGGGLITPNAMFDHRPVLDRYPIPADLTGKHCLDVGTMDGFFAFEMEARGAASVTAVDLDDPDAMDWPVPLRSSRKDLDETKAERFALVRRARQSSVERVAHSIYDLGPDVGCFDFVFCGDVLVHLKDPITACERLRSVCRGSAAIVTEITRFRRYRDRVPMAALDGLDHFVWWVPNMAGLVRIVHAAGFERVQAAGSFELPWSVGGSWRGLRGAVSGYV
jgi:2-polyprenyl-3-methyl-5-hydroxy-6-metoxy-1,4-benzoquinol methylase